MKHIILVIVVALFAACATQSADTTRDNSGSPSVQELMKQYDTLLNELNLSAEEKTRLSRRMAHALRENEAIQAELSKMWNQAKHECMKEAGITTVVPKMYS